jgi:phosphopantothenoylcysteine decarboxylase / phosphopantothenate---cysteine ligase
VSEPVTLEGRRIVVGVSGGIAAYKACELVSRLRQRGAEVWVVMTRNAQEFVGVATLRALSGRNVASEMFEAYPQAEIGHVSMAEFAEVLVVVPATANVIAKVAAGICDDLLTTTISAAAGRVLFAPAMNWRMWENPVTAGNVARLRGLGYGFIEPEEGWLACGEEHKPGRLAATETIIEAISEALGPRVGALTGRRLMVTAGPTR